MDQRLIMAVWRIRSLQLSRTEARYLVGSTTYGVVWEQVYGMLWKLASPESRAFTACTGHPCCDLLLVQVSTTPNVGHHAIPCES